MRKALTAAIVVSLLIGGFFALQEYRTQKQAAELNDMQTVTAERGELNATVAAIGRVRAYQSALLVWKTSGTVASIPIQTGETVASGQVLAELDPTSLSPQVLLAQADLISAQRKLDDLLNSDLQEARARQAVEDAQLALEEVKNPELAQANARQRLAKAEQALEKAQQRMDILTSPPPQSAIDQANANMLLAENKLEKTRDEIARIERLLNRNPNTYKPWESKPLFRKILKGLQVQLSEAQIKYQDALYKYNQLLEPPNQNDVALAEAELISAEAERREAQREWERLQDGPRPSEVAVLEAELEDAQREWERLKEGSDPVEVAAVEARITAARATLEQTFIAAPFDGVVSQVENQPGDQAVSGTPAFRLDDPSPMLVDVQVSEVDVNQVKVGQEVRLTFDAILAKEYHGKVVQEPLVGTQHAGVVHFKVTIELTDPDEAVKPGMTCSVDILVSQLEDVLLIPNQAVRLEGGKSTVYIMRPNGSMDWVEISLGASSGTHSEVLDGDLQPGDQIVLNPPTSLPRGPGSPGHP